MALVEFFARLTNFIFYQIHSRYVCEVIKQDQFYGGFL
jgi:hypothetical protein